MRTLAVDKLIELSRVGQEQHVKAVARQVGPLRQLLELRDRLSDLRGSMQGNDKLDEVLQQTIRDSGKLEQLKSEVKPSGENNE